MTMQPAIVSADPLEALNAPVAETTTDTDALPFPEEGAPGVSGGGETVTTTPSSPAVANWDSDENPFKAKFTEVTSTLEAYKPYLEKLSEAEAAQKAAAVDAIAKKVELASEESASPLSNEERMAVRTAITGYLAYKEQEPAIHQERLVGTAINYAGKLLGDTATIADLKKTAASLLQKYNTAQGMDAYVAARLEHMNDLTAQQRATTAAQRVATGVDNIASAPPQSGAMSSISDYERAIYKGVQLTEKQWANYKALRVQRGLD